MVSLVERLRRTEKRKAYLATCRTAPVIENEYDAPINPDGPEAADTIEAQAAAIELSRKALREACLALETPARRVFADNGDHTIDTSPLDPSIYSACYFASHAVYDALAKIDQTLSQQTKR